MAEPRHDPRSPAEIAAAQKSLVKILAVATGIPVVWVTLMSLNALANSAEAANAPGGASVFWPIVVWGLLSPVAWLVGNGYTWKKINQGHMEAGRFMPLLPAFWIIVWFTAGMVG